MNVHDPYGVPDPGRDDRDNPDHPSFKHPSEEPLSEIMARSVAGVAENVSVGQLVQRLSARGLAPLVMMVGLLNIVTIIPGSSTVMGLPLVFLGISLMIGARKLWLPQRLRNRVFQRAALERTVARALPYVRKIERMAHPRYWPGADIILDRVYGAFVLALALLVTLPIPFGNTLPALSIVLLSLGFTARDGLWVAAGLFCSAIAVGVIIGFISAVGFAGMHFFG